MRWMNVHQLQNKWDEEAPDILFDEIEHLLTLTCIIWKIQIILSIFIYYGNSENNYSFGIYLGIFAVISM